MAGLLRGRIQQPISTLAPWIVARDVFVLRNGSTLLLPLFQFDVQAGRVKPSAAAALTELRDVFDDWDLASWFTTTHSLLGADAPMNLMGWDGARVLEAARVNRYIAAG